jgi:hypothetical protein
MSQFKNIAWKQRDDLKFVNGAKIIVGRKLGDFKIDSIRDYVQKESDSLKAKGKIGQIGVSLHYATANMWVSAIMSEFGAPVKIFSHIDSPTLEAFVNDSIDGIDVYIKKTGNLDVAELENGKNVINIREKKDKPGKINKNIFKK